MARYALAGEAAYEPRSRRTHLQVRAELASAGHDAGPDTMAGIWPSTTA